MAKKVYKKDKTFVITGLVIEKGNIGSSDNCKVDIKGVNLEKITSECIVTRNFSSDVDDIIGKAKVYVDKDELKCDIVLTKDILQGWPAIGGQIVKRKGKVITEFKLTSVSICGIQNADKSIQNLSSQITEIEIEK